MSVLPDNKGAKTHEVSTWETVHKSMVEPRDTWASQNISGDAKTARRANRSSDLGAENPEELRDSSIRKNHRWQMCDYHDQKRLYGYVLKNPK